MDMQEFGWQPLSHDRIIRNLREYNAIDNYIRMNVQKWKKNKY